MPSSLSNFKDTKIKTNMNSPKQIAPRGVNKLRIRLLPVATVYRQSIHLALRVMFSQIVMGLMMNQMKDNINGADTAIESTR